MYEISVSDVSLSEEECEAYWDDRVLTSPTAPASHWSPPASPGLLIGQSRYYLVLHWTDSAIK